jgi:hypothetical protein
LNRSKICCVRALRSATDMAALLSGIYAERCS